MSKAMVTRLFVGSLLAIVGGLVLALIAALNTAQLQDKSWFLVLLLLGVFSFGFIAMLFYVVAGPDSTQPSGRQPWIQTRATASPTGA